jgi:hypothetical protein
MTYRAYGVCCGLFHSRDVAVQRLTLRNTQRLYVKQNPVLILMAYFMVVVGILGVV